MAPPSSSSTVTSARRRDNNDKTIRLNGKPGAEAQDSAAAAAADDEPELQRDPIEVKYRDFFWTYTEEPHRTRRLAIIKAHPEVSNRTICATKLPPWLTDKPR